MIALTRKDFIIFGKTMSNLTGDQIRKEMVLNQNK